MNIIFRKGVKISTENIERAMCWVNRKYPDVSFTGVDIVFGKGSKCRYFRNINDPKNRKPYVFIACNHFEICLYNMKTLKLKKTLAYSGYDAHAETGIVHELTHHVQYEKKLPTGELLTTSNELEYLETYYPEIYAKFK
jgi:hypothetical protein